MFFIFKRRFMNPSKHLIFIIFKTAVRLAQSKLEYSPLQCQLTVCLCHHPMPTPVHQLQSDASSLGYMQ